MSLNGKSDFARLPHPPVYRLIGPNGEYGGLFSRPADADAVAKRAWPDHHQDNSGDYEEPNGWDVEAVR